MKLSQGCTELSMCPSHVNGFLVEMPRKLRPCSLKGKKNNMQRMHGPHTRAGFPVTYRHEWALNKGRSSFPEQGQPPLIPPLPHTDDGE